MKFALDTALCFVPDGVDVATALKRTTHMAISAHQDDIEIMAVTGILECFQLEEKWFTGVVVTDGRGSPRDDLYKNFTDEAMHTVRIKEQKKAAIVGDYSAQILLDFPSAVVKNPGKDEVVNDLIQILKASHPKVVYTHNLADKHDTHVSTALRVIAAIRAMPAEERPEWVLGCEVWRGLDWMMDDEKVVADVTAHESLQMALLGVFDSQICGGKRYDLSTMGRRRANATYYASHDTDTAERLTFAMDLTPLVKDPQLDIQTFIVAAIDRFSNDVRARLSRYSKGG